MTKLTYEDAAYHQYCQNCGSDVIAIRDFVYSYDPKTGEEIRHCIFACLNWRWWRPYHFREVFDEHNKFVSNYDYL